MVSVAMDWKAIKVKIRVGVEIPEENLEGLRKLILAVSKRKMQQLEIQTKPTRTG